jgi:hypothetical protein
VEKIMSEEISDDRRRFLAAAAGAFGMVNVGLSGLVSGQSTVDKNKAATKDRSHRSMGNIKQINAGALNVGYAEAGPDDGPAVILFHGWPYDIHTYIDVAPLLAAKGFRVIIPYLRG